MFVISLDGVPPDEALDRLLAAVRSRLANDPEEERVVTAEELRRLARERLVRAALGEGGPRARTSPARVRQARRTARPGSRL